MSADFTYIFASDIMLSISGPSIGTGTLAITAKSKESHTTIHGNRNHNSGRQRNRRRHRSRFLLSSFYPNPLSVLATVMLLAWSSYGIGVCRFNKCTPNCICDYQFDDMCAMEYGNFGWRVPPTAQEYVWRYMRPDSPITTHEIKPVGMAKETQRLSGIGYANGKILNIDKSTGIAGQVYFEVHPSHLAKNEIVVELYGGIQLGFSDCAETGTLMGTTGAVGFSSRTFPFPNYNDNYQDEQVPVECHPRFTGAIVGAAEFGITNPFDGKGTIWYPLDGQENAGDLQYCVRVRVQPKGLPPLPNTEDKYHYIDTKFKIKGDRSTDFFASGKDIRIYTNQEFASKDAYVKANSIGVRAFLCSLPLEDEKDAVLKRIDFGEEYEGINVVKTKSFGIGQKFTVCVGPDEMSFNENEVVGFEDVICENDGQSRAVIEGGTPDVITVIDASTVGHIDYDMVAAGAPNGGIIEHPGVLAFRTSVTSGWLQREDRLITCTGVAKIEKRANPLNNRRQRHLRNSNNERRLQSLERQERGSVSEFTIQIGINNSTVFSRGEVPYPDDGTNECRKCKKTFLAFGILFLLAGGGGMAGWVWYTQYGGQDVIRRRRERYSACSSQCMLEEICANESDHQQIRKPFEDGDSSDDDKPVAFSDEEISVDDDDDCYKEDDDDEILTRVTESVFSDEIAGDRDSSSPRKKKPSRKTKERSDRKTTKKSKKSKKSKGSRPKSQTDR